MPFFYATRTQQVARNVTEQQLLKFPSRAARDNYCTFKCATSLTAREADKLHIINLWRTHYDHAVGVFRVASCVA